MNYPAVIFFAVCSRFAASQWLTALLYVSLASSLFGACLSFFMGWFWLVTVMVFCHVFAFCLALGVRIAGRCDGDGRFSRIYRKSLHDDRESQATNRS